MQNRRRVVGAMACVLLLGACGGGADGEAKDPAKDGDKKAAGAEQGQTPAGDTTGTTAAPGTSPGQGATPNDSRGIVIAPPPKEGDPTTTTLPPEQQQPTPLEVTLKSSCLRAGSSQTITIKAPAQGGVGYDSYYADGKSGISDGFYGGNNGAVVPDDGTWTDTWVVAPSAPPGKVKVIVQATKLGFKPSMQEHFYDLVGPAGTCP